MSPGQKPANGPAFDRVIAPVIPQDGWTLSTLPMQPTPKQAPSRPQGTRQVTFRSRLPAEVTTLRSWVMQSTSRLPGFDMDSVESTLPVRVWGTS